MGMGVVLNLFDVMEMIGIASFAISGAMVGIRKQLDFFGVLILGIVTAVGGGIIRDIMVGTVPRVLRKQIYFTAALAGAVCYIVLLPYLPEFWNMLLAVAVICVIRGLAFHYRWNLPRAKQAEFDE